MQRLEVGLSAAEDVDDFHRCAELADGVDPKNVHRLDTADAVVGILGQKGVKDSPGLIAVTGEDVALLDLFGSLLAGEGRLVVGDVADQVEGVVIGADLPG